MRTALLTLLWTGLCAFALLPLREFGHWLIVRVDGPPPPGRLLRDGEGRLLLRVGRQVLSSAAAPRVELDRFPDSCVAALIIQEDQSFFAHRGYSLRETIVAVVEAAGGERLRGASTISQQLARTLFLSRKRSLARKALELRIAMALENLLSKEQILELYLNRVYAGAGAGIPEAAAQRFGRPVQRLSREQCALLIALLPEPSVCPPRGPCRDAGVQRRQRRILQYLADADLRQQRGQPEPFRIR